MSDNFKILKNYILYFLVGLSICLVGITGVFADTVIDTSTWVDVSGRKWSITGLEYSSDKTFNNDVLLNNYNVTGGIYTPPADFDYITFSFFEHNTSVFNPCNSNNKFTATFRLLFTTPSFVNYVDSIKWGNDNCSITSKSDSTGWIDVSCIASPSSNNYTDIFINYTTISGTNTSNLYITRNIDVQCGLNTDAIINNDNANTQNVINNNNQNTQNIINNQNSNTDKEIESQQVCQTIDKNDVIENKKFFNGEGKIVNTNGNYGITDYIDISNAEVEITKNLPNSAGTNFCLYTKNKTIINCYITSTNEFPNLDNVYYIRTSVYLTDNVPMFKYCKNGNQALNDNINNLDDTLKDDNTTGAESEASEFFSSFDTETFGLTSIITAPLNLIRSVLSSTCTDLQLPLPYLDNKKLTLPCMSTIYSQFFGSFFTIYQTITYGIIAYWVCVRIFNQVKDFKNPEHDEIEVMDL